MGELPEDYVEHCGFVSRAEPGEMILGSGVVLDPVGHGPKATPADGQRRSDRARR